ncbi:MAG: DUF1549 domain-containing protein, partial [Planctomycetota bacterium]|nr:DUF1549 domain-containing protein [Planctomycetota bacterium]
MPQQFPRFLPARHTILIVCCLLGCMPATAFAEDDNDFFEKRVRPLLADRCEKCHSAAKGKTSGGLALDSRSGWSKGGDSGSPIVPGKPDESLLITAVRYDDASLQMPPQDGGGRLTDVEVATLVEWVSRGAPDPRIKSGRAVGMSAEEARTWWSFQPLKVIDPPIAGGPRWSQTEIDRFIAAKWPEQQLAPTAPADRRTLLRRVTFDLTGLPPTPTEVDEFLADARPDAWSRVVDRLLASRAYGERWARHWLDVVRYADFYDSNPKTRTASCEITEAWRYRDWVVKSLNDDLPFDEFTRLQIAGDTLPTSTGDRFNPDGLVATTFLTNGVWDRGDADKEKIVSDMADDNIDTVGKVFLGLTLGCARCHDHKFDPISTEDYYALAGIFYSSHILKELGVKGGEYTMNRVPLLSPAELEHRGSVERQLAETNAKIAAIDVGLKYQSRIQGGTTLVPTTFESEVGGSGEIASEGVVTVSGKNGKDA